MNLEVETDSIQVVHVYEIQLGMYPGINNENIFCGGYRRICVANQGVIELNSLVAKKEEDAILEVAEIIKRNHNYIYV